MGRNDKGFNQVGSKSGLIRGVAMSRNIIKPIFEFVKNKSLNLDIKKDLKNIVYEYFEAYWKAIKLIFPDMFKNTEKKEYNILKSSQAEVMSKLFIKIYQMSDETSKKHLKISDPKNTDVWKNLLEKPLTTYRDQTESLTDVIGKNCWLVGKKGSMGKYTSSDAKNQIANRLFEHFKDAMDPVFKIIQSILFLSSQIRTNKIVISF